MNLETAIPIGRGATGEVAKAWDPKLNRWIALKFLRHDTPEAQERMLREARVQAKIEHPNVCRVFDIGERDGQRYIAMQYVDGRPLDHALRELDIEAKVDVVRTVAYAVHAAHAAGLIHRDLKPANILVETTADGGFHPYVLDFGIAREQNAESATMTGQVIGTPGYLSPEQARGEVSTLDRRSDIFSLGVILYELLSGRRPHRGDSDADVIVNLLSEEAVPLRRIAPTVPPDLETIVMTCLEKDREKRYPTARALGEDLARFLAGEPIEARPTTTVEKLKRKAKRNPVAATLLGLASLAIAALFAALIASWFQYTSELELERTAAVEARERAEQKESEAQEVAAFLTELFEVADTGRTEGKTITARELLEKGAQNIETDLAGQPLVQARMMGVIASAYDQLGLNPEAEKFARKSLELRENTPGSGALQIAESHKLLGDVLNGNRNSEEAVEQYAAAAAIFESELGPDSLELALTRSSLASALLGMWKVDEAERHVKAALNIMVPALGPEDRHVVNARIREATILRARRDYRGAADIYEDILALQRRSLASNDLALALTLNNLAFMQRALGEPGRAALLYEEALAIHQASYPEPHPNQVQILKNLASALFLDGREENATEMLHRALEQQRSLYPEGHWRIGSTLISGLARSLARRDLCGEAVPYFEEGLRIWREGLGGDHTWTAKGEGEYALCLLALGRRSEAVLLATRSANTLAKKTDLTPGDWQEIEQLAERLEAKNEAKLAQLYRDILIEENQPPGLEQVPPMTGN